MDKNRVNLLVVDDDESLREMLAYVLGAYGKVDMAANGAEARQLFQNNEYQIVLLDYLMPEVDGMVLLQEFKELQPHTEIIMITHVRDVKVAVQAIKLGAFDYINKDFNVDDLKLLVQRALERIQSGREILYLRSEVNRLTDQEFIIGRSPKMVSICEILDRAAPTSATVLLQGESGTGKELVARYLHRRSSRATRPFVAVNMASIPDNLVESTLFGHERGAFTDAKKTSYGKFELANEGTLFLDEIAELKLELQGKLLRVMQESEVERVGGARPIRIDVRIVAATNRDLKAMVKSGTFREDLYYRLNVVPIMLPPLRERIEDIAVFVDLFLKRYNRKYGRQLRLADASLDTLSHYDWPGNVRELENLIDRLVAIHPSDLIRPEDIPLDYQFPDPEQFKEGQSTEDQDVLKRATDAFERGFILRVLEKEEWHQERTALRLGIHRKTLEYKIKKLNLMEIVDQHQKSKI